MNYRQRKYNEGQSARNDIYRFLVKYFEKHGYMPSYEEIMDGTDLTKCTVQRHMRQLEMDSLIATEHPGISRAYRLTEYRYERKKYGKQIKDESAKEKDGMVNLLRYHWEMKKLINDSKLIVLKMQKNMNSSRSGLKN